MPVIINQPNVTITTGSGVQSVRNPMYRYNFQKFPLDPVYFPTDGSVAGDAWLAKYPYTVRGAPDYLNSPSDPDMANTALLNSNLMSNTVSLAPSTPVLPSKDRRCCVLDSQTNPVLAVLRFGQAYVLQRVWNYRHPGHFY